ncbi:unnamed protein product [Tuber melanosporum]|uniref:Calmodulin n=1 Tax=Tuber melanosporum (strain Mel28) TaxID=656061 RepID=D5GLD7_TUBMM|nr:uncharacterized protein GSTUM_00010144001 [Tuber melanosporum]CAZ85330.1 unnamed protein product [Tuber melanosporum]
MYVDGDASEDIGEEVIAAKDVRRVLMGMGFESSKEEMNEILEIVDPDDEGWVTYERFLPVASLKLKDRDVHQEAEKAFQIFTAGQPGPITMEHLRRVAERLKEDVTDDQLREMLAVACTKEISRGVDLNDFQAVMKRAGVL